MEHVVCQAPQETKPAAVPWGGLRVAWQVTGIAPPRTVEKWNIWVNFNDLTANSLGMVVDQGNHPQMALIQMSELWVIYPETMAKTLVNDFGIFWIRLGDYKTNVCFFPR